MVNTRIEKFNSATSVTGIYERFGALNLICSICIKSSTAYRADCKSQAFRLLIIYMFYSE